MNGMDDNADETDLFDDEFDTLSETALQELEHHALLSTQQAQVQLSSNNPAAAAKQKSTLLPQAQAQARFNAAAHLRSPSIQRSVTEFQSEDDSYELVGEEGVPTPVEEHEIPPLPRTHLTETAQRAQWRQQRYGQSYEGVGHKQLDEQARQYQDGTFTSSRAGERFGNVHARPDEMLLDAPAEQDMDARDGFRLPPEDLMGDSAELLRELQAAKDALLMQKGEISIIRANFDKETKIFDRQMGALKKTMEEESAKHTAALNAMADKNNTLTTTYRFLQQEHNQELQELKTLKQRLKDRQLGDDNVGPGTTPKHGMVSSLRDGFDDDDIMVMSPSKSARRPKPKTPTATNKRKRKADVPSPVKPLVLRPSDSGPSGMLPPPQPQTNQAEESMAPIIRKDKQAERNLRFLQSILEYRLKVTKEPLFEALVHFSFPTSTSRTFSAMLLEGTARLQGSRLPGDLLQLFIDIWSRALKEQYYKPIALLVEVVNYIIDLDMLVLDDGIVRSLIPVLCNSVTVNAEKRFEHSPVNHSTFGRFRHTPQSVLNHEVNGTACLELLLTVAYVLSDEADILALFWRLMDGNFVLMMLNAWQPISDITLMLRLLATSIFPDTFGCISDGEQQAQIEHWIMNRICYLLWETPKVDEGLPANTNLELCQLRLEVMDLLIKLSITSSPYPHDDPSHHGSQLVAEDKSAIARIVRSLYDEVSAMYELTPSHALHAELVNKGVHLLFHVLQLHGAQINLQEKLFAINGGLHKHRVVLTRLAFSEGFFIDRLISDDTVAMATSMLEESVTPDEADELLQAFPGFKGRGRVASAE